MADVGYEARMQSILSSDCDNFRNKYQTNEIELSGNVINISLVAPCLTILDKYRFYILENCAKRRLEKKYFYRPDYLSYDEYGTTNWWYLILYINDIPTLQDFTREDILVPNFDCISRLSEISTEEKQNNLLNYDHLNETKKPLLFSSASYSFATDYTLENTVKELTSVSDPLEDRFQREEFVLDISTLRLRYIDLQYPAIENSIILTVRGKPNYSYGKHYILTESARNVRNRITWDPKLVAGSGLVFRLKEKDIIQVTYVKKL